MDWLIDNKVWLFSGAAIVVPLTVLGWFVRKRPKKLIRQRQRGGDGSINLQVARDLKIEGNIPDTNLTKATESNEKADPEGR